MENPVKMEVSGSAAPMPQRQARANNQPNKNLGKHVQQKQIDASDGGPAEKRQRFGGPNNQNGGGGGVGGGGGPNQNKNFGNKGGFGGGGGGGNRNRNRGGNHNRSNFQNQNNVNVSTYKCTKAEYTCTWK